MKIVIVGGHLSPALAVIEALPKDANVLFIGRKHSFEGDKAVSLEYKTINSLGIPFSEIISGRLQRKLTRHTINSLLKFPTGIIQSFFILQKFKPDAVLGFGGYVSLAVCLAAFLKRIPIVIHEQTLEAGFANKIISKFAKKICVSWESSRQFFPKDKTVMTGNPIRQLTINSPRGETGNLQLTFNKVLPTIYVTGGSAGSHFINTLIEGCIEDLLKKFNIIHQTGESKFDDYERLKNLRDSFPFDLRARYILQKFIDPSSVGSVLKNCDLAICRAGINTITELAYFEKPAILVPLPFSQGEEQLKNAKFLESHKLGKVIPQNEINSPRLYQEIILIFENIKKYKGDAFFKKLQVLQSAKKIIEVTKYAGKKFS